MSHPPRPRLLSRYADGEGGQAILARGLDASPVGHDDLLGNNKTEPGPTRTLPTGRIATVEPVEDVLEMLGGDFLAAIAHGKRDGTVICRGVNEHLGVGTGMRHRVLENVLEHATHAGGVPEGRESLFGINLDDEVTDCACG